VPAGTVKKSPMAQAERLAARVLSLELVYLLQRHVERLHREGTPKLRYLDFSCVPLPLGLPHASRYPVSRVPFHSPQTDPYTPNKCQTHSFQA
jgi:hypothetical protein